MTAAMMHARPRASLVKTACVLWVAGIVGAILVLPYVTELEAGAIKAAALASGLRPAVLLAMQMAQTAILLATAVFAGLWAARKIGLGVPILDALLSGQSVAQRNLTRLVPAVALGLAVGLVITVLDRKVFPPLAAGYGNVVPEPAAWKGLLASFYGAIDEELLLRLGFLSLIVLVLCRLARLFGATGDVLLPGIFWAANILAALVFGLGHLPATAAIAPLTPIVVARALILNAIAGIVCGWLYWQSGLEAAMFAHFTTDLVLHVVSPLLR